MNTQHPATTLRSAADAALARHPEKTPLDPAEELTERQISDREARYWRASELFGQGEFDSQPAAQRFLDLVAAERRGELLSAVEKQCLEGTRAARAALRKARSDAAAAQSAANQALSCLESSRRTIEEIKRRIAREEYRLSESRAYIEAFDAIWAAQEDNNYADFLLIGARLAGAREVVKHIEERRLPKLRADAEEIEKKIADQEAAAAAALSALQPSFI